MGERQELPWVGDETTLLLGWLAFYRETLAIKCDGLSDEQMKVAAVPPSNLSLLGLVRHLTDQEAGHLVWARGGGALELPYWSKEHEGADFDDVAGADVAATFATWRAVCDRSDQLIAETESLDAPGAGDGLSLRRALLKVIGEYARHDGHADLLREVIDGAVGE